MSVVILLGKIKKIYPSKSTQNGYDCTNFVVTEKKSFVNKAGETKKIFTDIPCCKFGEFSDFAVDDLVNIVGALSVNNKDEEFKMSVTVKDINKIELSSAEPISSKKQINDLPPFNAEDIPF